MIFVCNITVLFQTRPPYVVNYFQRYDLKRMFLNVLSQFPNLITFAVKILYYRLKVLGLRIFVMFLKVSYSSRLHLFNQTNTVIL